MEKKFELVRIAYENAFAKYSHFKVGACVVLSNGDYVIGANVENASYGLCNCAERNALFQAYSLGYRKDDILEIVIIADSPRPVSPCGACRQVMSELMNKEAIVTMTNIKGNIKIMKVSELLPYNFEDGDMNDSK